MEDWVKIAIALPVKHSRRMNCSGCGGDNTASVTNMGSHYVKFCFRCKETESKQPPPMTPQERLALQRAAEAFEATEPTLPHDFTTEIPVQGLLWLSKGGLHVNDIKRYGFGWSEAHRRVILPCWDSDGTLVCVQARNTGSAVGPKYLSQTSTPRPVFNSAQCGPVGDRAAYHGQLRDTRTLTLTEDILSAARVGKVCPAWSLLGTNLMPAVIERIASSPFTDIVIWMDDDDAGINARRKMLRQLNSVGIEARAVVSDRDPKNHTISEMKELLHGTS